MSVHVLPGRDVIERAVAFAGRACADADARDRSWDAASLLAACGFSDTVIAAGLLHAIGQDLGLGPVHIEASVDPEVARLVAAARDGSAAHAETGAIAAIHTAERLARLRAGEPVGSGLLDSCLRSLGVSRAVYDELAAGA
jgi:hypothetical protein